MKPLSGAFNDALDEFIHWLVTKTQAGRVVWENTSDTVTTTVKTLVLQFEILPSGTWECFSVSHPEDDELLIVSARSVSVDQPQLASTLNSLFHLARREHSRVN